MIPKRHFFFVTRVGSWRYEIWFRYEDGSTDPASGACQWRAIWGCRFWRWITAARITADLQREHDVGWWASEQKSRLNTEMHDG